MSKKTDSEILARRALQIQRGAARAAVLGVNDGLVSVLCIVLAVAGAGASTGSVLLAAFAGLISGAVSMAAGEWISVKSQVELFEGILGDLRKLVTNDRELLVAKLEASFVESGQQPEVAHKAATEMSKDDEKFITLYASQVMGFNSDELGSPWVAAFSSFVLFTLGALAPTVPWFFAHQGYSLAVWLSVIFTAIGSLIVGGYIASSSGKNVAYGAFRQLGIVILASIVTYGIGYLFGVSVV